MIGPAKSINHPPCQLLGFKGSRVHLPIRDNEFLTNYAFSCDAPGEEVGRHVMCSAFAVLRFYCCLVCGLVSRPADGIGMFWRAPISSGTKEVADLRI
jgi:hypothetical protein